MDRVSNTALRCPYHLFGDGAFINCYVRHGYCMYNREVRVIEPVCTSPLLTAVARLHYEYLLEAGVMYFNLTLKCQEVTQRTKRVEANASPANTPVSIAVYAVVRTLGEATPVALCG